MEQQVLTRRPARHIMLTCKPADCVGCVPVATGALLNGAHAPRFADGQGLREHAVRLHYRLVLIHRERIMECLEGLF